MCNCLVKNLWLENELIGPGVPLQRESAVEYCGFSLVSLWLMR